MSQHVLAIAAHEEAIAANRDAAARIGRSADMENISGALARQSSKAAKVSTLAASCPEAANWAGCANGAALNSRYEYAIENHERAIAAHRAALLVPSTDDNPAASFDQWGGGDPIQ